uniref:Uncharacterized protein n=1 Tax=Zea mays TaxID=4577 RepID=A0A804U8P3_MAIZE
MRDDDRDVVFLSATPRQPVYLHVSHTERRACPFVLGYPVGDARDNVRHVLGREAQVGAHPHGALELPVVHVVKQPVRPDDYDVAVPRRRHAAHLGVVEAAAFGAQLVRVVEAALLLHRTADDLAASEHGEGAVADVRPRERRAVERQDDGRGRPRRFIRGRFLVRPLQHLLGAEAAEPPASLGHALRRRQGVRHESSCERAGVHAIVPVPADTVRDADDAGLGVPEVRVLAVQREDACRPVHLQSGSARPRVRRSRAASVTGVTPLPLRRRVFRLHPIAQNGGDEP